MAETIDDLLAEDPAEPEPKDDPVPGDDDDIDEDLKEEPAP